ncbi:hypothetical protein QY96_00413 [Bacillus thermotolerans]|nr:hypothetical protein QY96_00413 [Bacillus thermotolerans]
MGSCSTNEGFDKKVSRLKADLFFVSMGFINKIEKRNKCMVRGPCVIALLRGGFY